MASNDKPQIVEASVSVHHGRQSSLPANVTHHVHFQQPPNRYLLIERPPRPLVQVMILLVTS